jgi:hypothetical protein
MLVLIRFPAGAVDRQRLEAVVQGCIGRAGAVVGASETSIDIQIDGDMLRRLLAELAAQLRELDMPPETYFDIAGSGQRLGIFDF